MPVPQRRQAPTQADVARVAGVSQGAVSAVIGGRAGQQRITAETARRVLDAVQELGYVANASARSLKGKRNRLLGVHTFESVFPISRMDFYHEFLIGIEEEAVAEGYDLVLFTSTEETNGQRQVYRGGSNRLNIADGSVLLGIASDNSDLARLAAEGYPFVHVGRRDVPGADIAWVGADYGTTTAELVGHLAALGHRNIGYVGDAERYEASGDRESGYRAGCGAAGVTPSVLFTRPEGLTTEWFDGVIGSGVTALMMENEDAAMRVAGFAHSRGLAIPQDLSIVVLIKTFSGPTPDRPWSTLGIPRNDMGRSAVRLLIEMIDAPDSPPDRHILLSCTAPENSTIAAAPTSR
ncbi:LacI family DNA-binding transcriptional regulator [Phytoactinopolyspora endophytica]|uniref:LacI family DNA-binding transcriptional regulator n=1 Tax=Phytoactinopolyspora endophytica TaxID=1642495 RepID=UPI00101D66D8|nr:LacI family DNA-binding transcriptional regulator [Phytoactinopolyspora endophytica]